jgi:hypothetical protein
VVHLANNDADESPFEFTIGGAVAPSLSIADVVVNEGHSGTSLCRFTVSLAYATETAVQFDIATADDTATAIDGDYTPRSLVGQVIPAGATSFTFDVVVHGDVRIEPDQTFFVRLTNVVGATVGDAQGVGTITNDDVTVYTYADWTMVNFSAGERADPAFGGLDADPYGVGLTNLLRYALDLPARGPVLSPVSTSFVGTTSTISFPIRASASGLQYIVQSSTDLAAWADVQSYTSTAAPQNISRSVAAPVGAPRFFLRLKVIAP